MGCVDWTAIYPTCCVGSAVVCHQCVWTGQLYILLVVWDQQQLVISVCGLDGYISYLLCVISSSLSSVCVDWTAIYPTCCVGSAAACNQCVWAGQLYTLLVVWDQQQFVIS